MPAMIFFEPSMALAAGSIRVRETATKRVNKIKILLSVLSVRMLAIWRVCVCVCWEALSLDLSCFQRNKEGEKRELSKTDKCYYNPSLYQHTLKYKGRKKIIVNECRLTVSL